MICYASVVWRNLLFIYVEAKAQYGIRFFDTILMVHPIPMPVGIKDTHLIENKHYNTVISL